VVHDSERFLKISGANDEKCTSETSLAMHDVVGLKAVEQHRFPRDHRQPCDECPLVTAATAAERPLAK
jgi:hypothetical protein